MSKTREKKRFPAVEIVNPSAAGIDIGSKIHYVAVPPGRDEKTVRTFGCFTSDLYEMVEWLDKCGIETIAMESTGVYWIPVFQILEAHCFNVILVNASHVKNVPGRKTDVSDCQWIQQLHSFGLLKGSFRPSNKVTVYRSYARYRDKLIKLASSHVHRMQKALDQMNIQLHKVISDITGLTGMSIITAILNGERDPVKLAKLKNFRIRSSTKTIAKALEGDWREEHLFVLQQEFDIYHYHLKKIEECDAQIKNYLSQFESKVNVEENPLPKPKRKPQKNQPKFDLRKHLYRIAGVDLTTVDGFNVQVVQILISECGYDLSKWPTEKHFASWLGLCPNNKITGQKVHARSTRKVVNRAAIAFRMSAQSLHHSKSALGAYYRRMKSRLGPAKANTATARKLACIFYRMLKFGKEYIDVGLEYYEQKYRERCITNLKRNAKRLGFKLLET